MQSGRSEKIYVLVSLLRPPSLNARSRGGRQFLFNNYVEVFVSPNRLYRAYLSHTVSPTVRSWGRSTVAFTYNYVEKVF